MEDKDCKDYSYLEGKEVLFTFKHKDDVICIVAGCDFDIGITLVSKDNKDRYLACLRNPDIVMAKTGEKVLSDEAAIYPKMFKRCVELIKNGVWPESKIPEYYKRLLDRAYCNGGAPNADYCAFG